MAAPFNDLNRPQGTDHGPIVGPAATVHARYTGLEMLAMVSAEGADVMLIQFDEEEGAAPRRIDLALDTFLKLAEFVDVARAEQERCSLPIRDVPAPPPEDELAKARERIQENISRAADTSAALWDRNLGKKGEIVSLGELEAKLRDKPDPFADPKVTAWLAENRMTPEEAQVIHDSWARNPSGDACACSGPPEELMFCDPKAPCLCTLLRERVSRALAMK